MDKVIGLDEGNKAIMLFDGWVIKTMQTLDPAHNNGSNSYEVYSKNGVTVRTEDIEFDIVYHQSWNALMPVVEKIESLGYEVFISKNACYISKRNGEIIVHCNNWENKITTVYQAVESFINWYNTQKQQHGK